MGGPYIGIVADDLTGSGDTAVQFVRAGWATQLSVGGAEQALADPAVRQAEVLAVTTHSRPLAAADAAAVVRGEVERLRAAGVQRLYKKVDSTLRGAFKAEIDAARLAWGEDAIAVVCPAFPVTGRTVRQGVLYVGDRPVTETSAATDPVTPVTESHIPTLLGCAQLAAQAGKPRPNWRGASPPPRRWSWSMPWTTPMCSGWRAPSACWASAPCPSARAGWPRRWRGYGPAGRRPARCWWS